MKQQQSTIALDGVKYVWWISRNPQWCHEDGWQGVQLTIVLEKYPKKQLLVQLPFAIESKSSTPHKQRPKIGAGEVASHIKAAINSGWDPNSKGKPFKCVVE